MNLNLITLTNAGESQNDTTTILVALILTILIAVFFLFLTTFIISLVHSTKFQRKIFSASNTMRVYVLDVKNDKVTFFNRSSVRNKRTATVTDFYNQFPSSEREKLINWVDSLISDPKTPSYLELNVLFSRIQKKYPSLLQVEHIDRKHQLIHLESYVVKNNFVDINKKIVYRPSSEEEIVRALLESNHTRGYTVAFDFFYKRGKRINENFVRYALVKIRDIFLQHLSLGRYLYMYSEMQFIFFDLKAYNRSHVMLLINMIKQDVNRFLMLNSLTDTLDYTIGIVENKTFSKEEDHAILIKNAVDVADFAKDDNVQLLWYEQGMRDVELNDSNYHSEVERIIHDKKLLFTFRPIFDIDKRKPLGYLSIVKPQDTFFDSISELKDYALRTDDDKELFGNIASNVISRFYTQRRDDSVLLFFPIKLHEKRHVIKSLIQVSNIKDIHVVLTLSMSDLMTNSHSTDSIVNDIRTFQVKGYQVALSISEKELSLPDMIMEMFDYFIIDSDMTSNLKSSSRARMDIHVLIEKLLAYTAPIIVSDLNNWSSVELMVKIGIKYISGEFIAPSDEMILPVPTKIANKIKALA